MSRRTKLCVRKHAVLIALLAACGACFAGEHAFPEMPRPMFELRKRGTVDVTRDEQGEVTSIRLVVTSYNITLDEGSKPLEDMDGKTVRVLGTYERVNEEGWFTVSKVELLETEPGKKPEDEPVDEAATILDDTREREDAKAEDETDE